MWPYEKADQIHFSCKRLLFRWRWSIIIIKQRQDTTKARFETGYKRVIIVDDDIDITTTFRTILEEANVSKKNDLKYKVYIYNRPEQVLADFEPDFYDLMLIDVNMPGMDGFELSRRLLEMDLNLRICFMTAGEINLQAMREVSSVRSIGCFITKPISADDFVKKIRKELE
jgi:FixJ family two-component response regulator